MFILSSPGFLREWMFAISTTGIQNQNKTEQDSLCQSIAILTWKNQRMSPERFNAWKASDCTIFMFIFFYTKVNFIYLDNSQ